MQTNAIRDVDASLAWQALSSDQTSRLIDVRTKAEWSYVGIPDTAATGNDVILLEWQTFPAGTPNPDFVSTLMAGLENANVSRSSELYFLCRSGVRSLAAAQTMQAQGYSACFNVAHGFEGPLDQHQHRGTTAGWKAAGLPWKQG